MKNGEKTKEQIIGEGSEFRQTIAEHKNLETGPKRAKEEIRHLSSFPEWNPNPTIKVNLAGQGVYSNSAAQAGMARPGRE
jgi:hypothetical protein